MSSAEQSAHQRVSSGSSRTSSSSRSRSNNPQQQLSQIEKSVTHLLVATKQLLETLTSWSRGQATETEVSDVYVRLGYEFNIACRAFNGIGVETSDLGPVPDLLRAILEETLSQEASQQSLDKFLPRIRDIIINLLHGLKKKQSRLRQKSAQSSQRPDSITARQGVAANDNQAPDESVFAPSNAHRQSQSRQTSADVAYQSDTAARSAPSSALSGRSSPRSNNASPIVTAARPRDTSRESLISPDSSNASLTPQDNISEPESLPYSGQASLTSPLPDQDPPFDDVRSRQKVPVPMQRDALAALQRGGDLERRASRRFSAYQIQKHLGTPNGVPIIPPAQNSPIPNRGKEAQESITAVRTRSSYVPKKQSPRKATEASPLRNHSRIATDQSNTADRLQDPDVFKSPPVRATEDGVVAYPFPDVATDEPATVGPTLNGPMEDGILLQQGQADVDTRVRPKTPDQSPASARSLATTPPRLQSPVTNQRRQPSTSSPQSGKELTLFLQYKSKIKKFVLADASELTIARLQLAFIEKFAWNTQNNGADLPDICIQDQVSGVRYDLEDLSDIKERSVLVLNVEPLDEVKRHIDDGVGSLKRVIDSLKVSVDDQQAVITRLSDGQKDAARDIASLAAAPQRTALSANSRVIASGTATVTQLEEVQSLRRDLAVVRQVYSSFVSDINSSMAAIRTKASTVGQKAETAQIPSMSTDSGRAYVNAGKKTLQDDSEKIVTAVDDLQDTVEDLRKDVVLRGVRPLPRQLETLSKDISAATSQLKKLKSYLKKEKPTWTKIWEKELQVVCDDRDLLTMQEELSVDLEDDLEKAAATFSLVEQATRQQNMENARNGGTGVRSTSRTMPNLHSGSADPHTAKNGVLGEVKALQPNHESRLEAIERAEKARQRELEDRRGGEFEKELGNFVTDQKLKKSGGVEEVERLRKARDEQARREYHERQQARAAGNTAGAVAVRTPAPAPVQTKPSAELSTDQVEQNSSSPEDEFIEADEGS